MSIAFNEPMNEMTEKMLREEYGAFTDKQIALLNDTSKLEELKADLLEVAEQSATIELNEIGETKEMSDGTVYEVTKDGRKYSGLQTR